MITDVNVSPLSYSVSNTVGLASVTVDNAVVINSIQIKQNQNGELYLQMPQKQRIDKNNPNMKQYDDIAFPITKEAHEELNNKVFEKFKNPDAKIGLFDPPQSQQPQIDVNIAKYSYPRRDGQIGAGTLTVNDSFVIKDVRVYQAKDGSMYYKLPYKKDLSGQNDRSIVSPASKDMHKKIDQVIKAEMGVDYSYRLVDNQTFQKMRDTCPDLFKQCSSSSEGKNVKIKFDSANKEQINEMLGKLSAKKSPNVQQVAQTAPKPKM